MKKIFIPILALMVSLTSCQDYLNINTDPNSPSDENITADMVLPGVEMNLATSYGNFFRIIGGYYSQHYAHNFGTSNYLDFSRFEMSATRSSSNYTQLNTRVLKNLEEMRIAAESQEDWGTYLVATTLRVFTYQALVDAYGEVPYSEALNIAIISPKFDEGETIYDGILAELDDALSKVSSTDKVPVNFLFGSATAEPWIQFANALKLKVLMRLSDVRNVSSELSSLIAEDNFPLADVSWDDCWVDEKGKASPLYQEETATYFGSTQVNLVLNIAYMRTMQESNDKRLQAFFLPNNEDGIYTGGVSGTNFSTSTDYRDPYFCKPAFTYDMPVYLITVSEVEFFLAEYHARYGTASDAEQHYKNAIDASFATAGISGADQIYNVAYPWNSADYKKLIGLQKWVALGGVNNFEAWCELRRLKFPAMGSVTGGQLYNVGSTVYQPELYQPGTLYTPIDYNTNLGAGKVLQRLRYAESSTSRNSNAPATKPDSEPVFWAK
jgi:hypothetical protein